MIASGDLKTCSVCKARKPRSEFHRWSRSRDGLMARCKPCARASGKVYRQKHHEQVLAGKKAAYRRDPAKNRAKNAEWKAKNPERHQYLVRRSWLKQIYNMTHEDYDALIEAQGGVCAICGDPPKTRRLAVDHDHRCCPGKRSCGNCIRGLLCFYCNRLLGWYDARREAIDGYVARVQLGGSGTPCPS